MLHNIELQAMVAPAGWGFSDRDVSIIDGGSIKRISVTNDFESHLEHCDMVLISKSYNHVSFDNYLLSKINKSLGLGKKILLSTVTNYLKKINELSKDSDAVEDINQNDDMKIAPKDIKQELKKLNTPIILVAGLGDRCNKFETQLSIRRTMVNLGYTVCQLGTKGYSSLFGFKKMPDFLFDESYSMEDRIYLFNQYIFNLEVEQNPDVFIIGVPGGIMPFDDIATNYFAMVPFIVGNAIQPDVTILNVYQNILNVDYLKELYNYCKYKFGFDVSCFNIANTKFNINNEDIENYIKYLSLNSKYVMDKIPEEVYNECNVCNILTESNEELLSNHILDILTGNISMVRHA